MDNGIVAVGLLTQRDLDVLGPAFTRAYPVDDSPCFLQLLHAIDEADRERRAIGDPTIPRGGPQFRR